MPPLKPLWFVGSAREALQAFPEIVMQAAGYELFLVQCGQEPHDWKSIRAVGPGVREIRIHHEGQYRVFYVANLDEAICVLHVFQKKTRRTCQHDIEIARRRLRTIRKSKDDKSD